MKASIIAVATAAALAANTGMAAKSDKNREEGIGIGSGGVIGAIAGGPVGFIIGAAAGGWLGNKFNNEREEKETYAARYREAEELAASLESLLEENETATRQMRLVMQEQEDSYRTALSEALDVEIYFHTGEASLDAAVADRIERLGDIVRGFEDFSIVVEGHADPRGDESYNEQLSAERAEAVRAALIRSGLPDDRIATRAAGEAASSAAENDLDAMALERRVNLSIVYPLPRENRVAKQ